MTEPHDDSQDDITLSVVTSQRKTSKSPSSCEPATGQLERVVAELTEVARRLERRLSAETPARIFSQEAVGRDAGGEDAGGEEAVGEEAVGEEAVGEEAGGRDLGREEVGGREAVPERETPADSPRGGMLDSLLDSLASGQRQLPDLVGAVVDQRLADWGISYRDQLDDLSNHVKALRKSLRAKFEHLAETLAGLTPQVEEAPPLPSDHDWQQAVLGETLLADESLAPIRAELVADLLRGDSAARALGGQLMLAPSVPEERLPQVMKEVGEAYYRWRPKRAGEDDPLELRLAAWLRECCRKSGLGNSIELVLLGDRFDATRHNSVDRARGVEVSGVFGWVVLRDNGKVFTKANVAVK